MWPRGILIWRNFKLLWNYRCTQNTKFSIRSGDNLVIEKVFQIIFQNTRLIRLYPFTSRSPNQPFIIPGWKASLNVLLVCLSPHLCLMICIIFFPIKSHLPYVFFHYTSPYCNLISSIIFFTVLLIKQIKLVLGLGVTGGYKRNELWLGMELAGSSSPWTWGYELTCQGAQWGG